MEIDNDRARGYRLSYDRGNFNLTLGKQVFPMEVVKH